MVAAILVLAACAGSPERNETLMDTGLPLTDNMRAYDVDRYTLRHEILVEGQSIAGSATISFDVLSRMESIELNFDGQYDMAVGSYTALEPYNVGQPHGLELIKVLGGAPLDAGKVAEINRSLAAK